MYCISVYQIYLMFFFFFFFFNDTATTEIYTLSLHDALPISAQKGPLDGRVAIVTGGSRGIGVVIAALLAEDAAAVRSEEHTSELQSQSNLVCRLLLEKKKRPKADHKFMYVSYTTHKLPRSSF